MNQRKPGNKPQRPKGKGRPGKDSNSRRSQKYKGGKPGPDKRRSERSSDRPRKQEPPARASVAPTKKRLRRKSGGAPSDPILELFHTQEPELSVASIEALLGKAGVPPEPGLVHQCLQYLGILLELNDEINLVSRATPRHAAMLSLLDSFTAALRVRPLLPGKTLLDLGSGGGFPGIPFKLFEPSLRVTLLDARRAKTMALRRIVEDLELEDVEIEHDRAEIFPDHNDTRFDLVTVRAVGSLKEVLPVARPLLAEGGTLLAWKGPEGMREWKESGQDTVFSLDKRHLLTSIRSVYVFTLKS